GDMPAPAKPDGTPAQEGRPSKQSEDVPPPAAPAPGDVRPAQPVDADAFFADEDAVALLAAGAAVAVLPGAGGTTRGVGRSGFAAVGLAAVLGRCWLEGEANNDAARRRAQACSFLEN